MAMLTTIRFQATRDQFKELQKRYQLLFIQHTIAGHRLFNIMEHLDELTFSYDNDFVIFGWNDVVWDRDILSVDIFYDAIDGMSVQETFRETDEDRARKKKGDFYGRI